MPWIASNFLIATGQRREEVASLDWRELDRSSREWTLPAGRSKNKQSNVIPLNELALAELDQIASRLFAWAVERGDIDRSPFGGFRGPMPTAYSSGAMSLTSTRARRSERAERSSTNPEPLHSCREGAAKVMDPPRTDTSPASRSRHRQGREQHATAAVERFEVTEAVLNHVSGSRSGVAGIYQSTDPGPFTRALLEHSLAEVVQMRAERARRQAVKEFPELGDR